MDYITFINIMNGITNTLGNIMFFAGIAGLIVLGRALHKAYARKDG